MTLKARVARAEAIAKRRPAPGPSHAENLEQARAKLYAAVVEAIEPKLDNATPHERDVLAEGRAYLAEHPVKRQRGGALAPSEGGERTLHHDKLLALVERQSRPPRTIES